MKQTLKQLWLAETIRLNERQSHKMDDDSANRNARLLNGTVEQRILFRAQWLGQNHGLLNLQQQTITGSKWALLVLFVVAIFIGAGLAITALSVNPVNIFWALLSLLGLHCVTLLIWLLTLCLPFGNGLHSVLGRLWEWLAVLFSKQAKPASLFPALFTVLEQKKATRWLIGLIANGFWLVILLSAFVFLILLMSVKHYSFVWQTTLFDSDSFLHLTQFLGFLPSLFGFVLPDPGVIVQSGASPLDALEIRQTWALWLIGVFVIYGILPRAVCFLACGVMWWISTRNLHLNLLLPEYQILAEIVQPSHESVGVVDAEKITTITDFQAAYLAQASGKAMVAIELSGPWYPALAEGILNLGVISDRTQRKRVIDTLSAHPVQALLIVCDAKRSPDRGTTRLLRELMDNARDSRLLLLHDSEYEPYWQEIRQTLQLDEGDLAWLEAVHD